MLYLPSSSCSSSTGAAKVPIITQAKIASRITTLTILSAVNLAKEAIVNCSTCTRVCLTAFCFVLYILLLPIQGWSGSDNKINYCIK